MKMVAKCCRGLLPSLCSMQQQQQQHETLSAGDKLLIWQKKTFTGPVGFLRPAQL